MILFRTVCWTLNFWIKIWTNYIIRRNGTCSSCSITSRAGVRLKKILTTQRAATMPITQETSEDHQSSLSMPQKIVRLWSMGLAGTNVQKGWCATSVTPLWSDCTTRISISGSCAISIGVTNLISVLSTTTWGSGIKLSNCVRPIANPRSISDCLMSSSYTTNCSKFTNRNTNRNLIKNWNLGLHKHP